MDPQTLNQQLNDLVRQSNAARIVIHADAQKLRHHLDFPSRIKNSIHTNPQPWFLGSIGAGLASSIFLKKFFSKKSSAPSPVEKTKKGFIPIILGLAFSAAKPFLKSWLMNQLTSMTTNTATSFQTQVPTQTPRNRAPFI